jgi:hypothetical protein
VNYARAKSKSLRPARKPKASGKAARPASR